MTSTALSTVSPQLISTGIEGLDVVLQGGLAAHHLYVVDGNPGAGKTTLALQYLLEGRRLGQKGLFVTLSETERELHLVASSHGWNLDGIEICELAPPEESLQPDSQYTMFHPSEVELHETMKRVLDQVKATNPERVVFDSLSEMRMLAREALRYRRQIMALKQFFTGRHCTVLLLDDLSVSEVDMQVQSLAHGVIRLEQLSPEFGGDRRRLRVIKTRGRGFSGGYHDFIIQAGGLQVFPRLIAAEHRTPFERGQIQSGIPAMDKLLGGGLDRGNSALIMGPAGSGKSTIAAQFAAAEAERGHKAAVFVFDEACQTLVNRTQSMGIPMDRLFQEEKVIVQQIDPAELAPGQFAHLVRQTVEQDGARLVVIDSLNGYLNAMPEERFLTLQLHELLTYLGNQGVTTILVVAQHGLLGTSMQAPVDTSYIADTVILLRFFEAGGAVHKSIATVKRRGGAHETTIRELNFGPRGIHVGEPLRKFHGVLSGIPAFLNSEPPALTGSLAGK
ncbi:MAG: AAA family ATPase [Verrucomicrobiae bacterium]|nr:AAA family ATPase [Verrucomicrobiae bacterium]